MLLACPIPAGSHGSTAAALGAEIQQNGKFLSAMPATGRVIPTQRGQGLRELGTFVS